MRAQLDDAHERGEPLAALWASEETIYGRFGYGLASCCGEITLAREYNSFAQPFEPQGTLRLIDADEALEAIPPVFEQIRPEWPGMFSRSRPWWENREIADPEERRDGAGPKRWVAYERDGSLEGYAVYRHKPGFEAGTTNAELRVLEALGTTPEALRDVWRYLLDIDWIATIESSLLPPDHALFLLLATPRRRATAWATGSGCASSTSAPRSPAARYQARRADRVRGADAFCPGTRAAGSSRAAAPRTEETAGSRARRAVARLRLLGGVSFATLRRAGRLEELTDGAIARGGLRSSAGPPSLVSRDLLSYRDRLLGSAADGPGSLRRASWRFSFRLLRRRTRTAARQLSFAGPPTARSRRPSATTAPAGIRASTSASSARSTSAPPPGVVDAIGFVPRLRGLRQGRRWSTSATALDALRAPLVAARARRRPRVRGQRLGIAGCTGWCTGTHLHFELRDRGDAYRSRPAARPANCPQPEGG